MFVFFSDDVKPYKFFFYSVWTQEDEYLKYNKKEMHIQYNTTA